MTRTEQTDPPKLNIDVTSLHHRRASNRWERTSVGDFFERLRWSFPEKEAIVASEGAFAYPQYRRITYRQADELANQVANALLARGLEQGDRVLMFCENSVEAFVAKIGVAKAGLVCVPLNPMLADDVVKHLIDRVEPRFAIVDDELWPKASRPFSEADLPVDVMIPLTGEPVPAGISFAELTADAPIDEPEVEIHGDDIWEIIFTSGTTAMPKGAMISHNYSHFAAYAFALTLSRGIRFECDLKLCSFLPLIYHIADQIFSFPAFVSGGTLVMGRRYDAALAANAIAEERVTAHWGGSPAMLEDLAAALRADPSRLDASCLKVIVFGWTAIHPQTAAELKRLTKNDELTLVEILGQTEAISCHRFWPDMWPEIFEANAPARNYVGVPCPILDATMLDEEDNPLDGKPGIPGEVVYRSPSVIPGYYRDEDATEQAFKGGWFHSGDVCMYDDAGLRVMVDRSKDIVKSGGENVSSLRVESVLRQHPAVAKAAVVGLPHEHWGEAVTAIVVPAPGAQPDPQEIVAFCRERLAGYESPKGVVVVSELPETVGGKVLKYKLREAHSDFYDG